MFSIADTALRPVPGVTGIVNRINTTANPKTSLNRDAGIVERMVFGVLFESNTEKSHHWFNWHETTTKCYLFDLLDRDSGKAWQ